MNCAIKLKTLSPVFIGSGVELNKKEYVRAEKDVIVTDMPKLYRYLQAKGFAAQYETFLSQNRKGLDEFLAETRIAGKDYAQFTKYRIDSGEAFRERLDNRGKTSVKGIASFMRDAYGKPYLPGSSVKGALRTAVLSRLVSEDAASYRQAAGEDWINGRKNDRSGRAIEEKAFRSLKFNENNRNDAVNDIFRAVSVSDSRPLKDADMTLCQKIDEDVEGNEHAINILRECVKPGAAMEIPLSIDRAMFASLSDDPCRYIMDCVKVLSEYQSKFADAFEGSKPYAPDEIIIGGGAGYVSKTVTYPMYQEDAVGKVAQLMQNQFRNHKHDRDVRTFHVSPHALKCTRWNGVLYDMGLCEIAVEER
ncbi:type III-A CRISPR-associated RAMP protein Csm5 [Synergistales bacterium]|nr:type III-A CRISPR-associated RAMP protein Csm5 [Synergistales bacterium]